MALESYESFEKVKLRLDEIVDAVGSNDLPLDEALALYEEAVSLGLRASDLLETNIEEHDLQNEALTAAGEDEARRQDDALESTTTEQAFGSSLGVDAFSPVAADNADAPATA